MHNSLEVNEYLVKAKSRWAQREQAPLSPPVEGGAEGCDARALTG